MAVLLLSCGGPPDPSVPEQPVYDPRAATRCERGAGDDQNYTLQQWKACFNAARFFGGQAPVLAIMYSRKSCELHYDEGCLQYLDFVHAMSTRHEEAARGEVTHARELADAFCQKGLYDFVGHDYKTAEACHLAGELHQDVEPVDLDLAKTMFEEGCKRHDEGSCTLIAHRYSK